MTINKIHVLGERCSGTNYLKNLLEENTTVPVYDELIVHKHFAFQPEYLQNYPNVLFIVITKNLENFVKSIYETPHHMVGFPLDEKGISYGKGFITMSEFIVKPITSDIRFTKTKKIKYCYENEFETHDNIVYLYYQKLLFFLSLRKFITNIEYVQYEDLRDDQEIISKLLKKHHIRQKHDQIKNITYYKSDKSREYKPKTYTSFTSGDLDILSGHRKNFMTKYIIQKDIYNLNLHHDDLEYFAKKYNLENIDEVINHKNDQPLPKIIHLIWIGSNVPEKYISSVNNCANVNTKWKVFLWIDKNSQEIKKNIFLENVELHFITQVLSNIPTNLDIQPNIINFIPNYGYKADILRLLIVYQFGGIYSDIDSVWLNPLDENFSYEFLNYRDDVWLKNISNAFFGFCKNSKFMEIIIKNLKIHINHVSTLVGRSPKYIPLFSGPVYLTYMIKYFLHYKELNFISQAFCIVGNPNGGPVYRHYGKYQKLIYCYQTCDKNWCN